MLSEKKLSLERLVLEVKPVAEFLDGVEKELLTRGDKPNFNLASLPGLNRIMHGLREGLTVIGARTSIGKSSVALQFAYDLAKQDQKVLFLSLEMTVDSMIERLFCNEMMVDNYALLTGQLKTNLEISRKWFEFKDHLKEIPLILTCGIGMSFSEITDVVEHLEERPDAIFVDYIQAIRTSRDEREILNEYIRHFRGLCIQNKIAGILCSQSNRQTFDDGNKEPILANLKGTGNLEECADTVLLLHWPYFYDKDKSKNEYKILIAKQRNGRTGEYILHYQPEFYKFCEIEKREEYNAC